MVTKYLLVLLLSAFVLNGFAQENCDTMFWSAGRKLTWNDFKPLSADSNAAATEAYIRIGYKVSQEDDYAFIKVSNYLIPCMSFTKNNHDDQMLQHEQLHFD